MECYVPTKDRYRVELSILNTTLPAIRALIISVTRKSRLRILGFFLTHEVAILKDRETEKHKKDLIITIIQLHYISF